MVVAKGRRVIPTISSVSSMIAEVIRCTSASVKTRRVAAAARGWVLRLGHWGAGHEVVAVAGPALRRSVSVGERRLVHVVDGRLAAPRRRALVIDVVRAGRVQIKPLQYYC